MLSSFRDMELIAKTYKNFSGNTVAFWHSTGSDPLALVVPAVSTSTSSNGADWHLGVLELPVSGQADTNEDYYFSGVYIESGSLTTSVAGPGGVVVSPPVSSSSAVVVPPTSSATSKATTPATTPVTTAKPTTMSTSTKPASVPTTSAAPAGGNLSKWSQCGGIGWQGSGTCVSGTTCKASGDYYSQCL